MRVQKKRLKKWDLRKKDNSSISYFSKFSKEQLQQNKKSILMVNRCDKTDKIGKRKWQIFFSTKFENDFFSSLNFLNLRCCKVRTACHICQCLWHVNKICFWKKTSFFRFSCEQPLNFCDHSPFILFQCNHKHLLLVCIVVINIYEPFIIMFLCFLCLDIRKVNKTLWQKYKYFVLFLEFLMLNLDFFALLSKCLVYHKKYRYSKVQ